MDKIQELFEMVFFGALGLIALTPRRKPKASRPKFKSVYPEDYLGERKPLSKYNDSSLGFQ